LAARYDYEQIGRGRLTNDALIAMSAGRSGITVITANARDFMRLAEFRPFHWQVQALPSN
jgi:predicted nucleic acid-binding protein